MNITLQKSPAASQTEALSVLEVEISRNGGRFVLHSSLGDIAVETTHPQLVAWPERADFAAWLFLPLAMRKQMHLRINGTGSHATVAEARKMSAIWQSWLPGHFSSTSVSFSQYDDGKHGRPNKSLCFYSGGVDSTYTLLRRRLDNQIQDVITLHGMDYRKDDFDRFNKFKAKIEPFSNLVAAQKIYARTNAYEVYDSHQVNIDPFHVTHIFALAGVGFLHTRDYNELIIAADHRLDQQFIVQFWGSNSATNHLFNDGLTRLVTDADDLTRSEKMVLLSESPEALASLTFCVNYESRPDNCGICSKCIRTKLMFLASTGSAPKIFTDDSIPDNWIQSFRYEKPNELAFALDVLNQAESYQNQAAIPSFEDNKAFLLAYLARKSGPRETDPTN